MGKPVNKRELAEIVGKSETTLTDWQDAGMPIEAKGEFGTGNTYDTEKCIEWLIARQVNRGTNLENERAELTRLLQQEKRLKLAKETGELVLASEIESIWAGFVSSARAFALQLPLRLASELEAAPGEETKRAILDAALREFLKKLTDYEPDSTTDHQSGEGVSSAGSDDGGGVGG